MAKFRFTPGSISGITQKLNATTEKMQRKAIFALAIWADDTLAQVKAEVIRVKAFDTGNLYGSIARTAPQRSGRGRVKVAVFTAAEYATIVEFGRRKGKAPPLAYLIGWAKRHGMVRTLPVNASLDRYQKELAAAKSIRRNAKKGRKGGKGRSAKALDPVIRDFLVLLGIQDAIRRRGMKGRLPMTKVIDRRKRTFLKDMSRLIQSGP